MTDLVVDTSAFVFGMTIDSLSAVRLRQRMSANATHVPHLFDAEVGSVLRRLVLAGRVEKPHAADVLSRLPALVTHRYPHTGALGRAAWQLRSTVSFYDALYVVLAVALDAPLITRDGKLAKAPGLPCRVELVADDPA